MEPSELSNADFVAYQAHKGEEEELRAKAAKMLTAAAIHEQLAEEILTEAGNKSQQVELQ